MKDKAPNDIQLQALQNIRLIIAEAPSLRVCQVIGNILPAEHNGDPYYLTDEKLRDLTYQYLLKLVKERTK